jgi:hypothetical protein
MASEPGQVCRGYMGRMGPRSAPPVPLDPIRSVEHAAQIKVEHAGYCSDEVRQLGCRAAECHHQHHCDQTCHENQKADPSRIGPSCSAFIHRGPLGATSDHMASADMAGGLASAWISWLSRPLDWPKRFPSAETRAANPPHMEEVSVGDPSVLIISRMDHSSDGWSASVRRSWTAGR